MLILIHKDCREIIKVLKGEKVIELTSLTCTEGLWELAARFPEEIIGWCDSEIYQEIALENWEEIFHHNHIIASYAVKTTFLPESIGFIDQSPFININRDALYGTWQMSSDIGGIYGEVLLKFKPIVKDIKDFNYLLNSIGKIGQDNGLFCYSAPLLTNFRGELKSTATTTQLFSFVHRHYKRIWSFILLWCLIKFEKKMAFWSLIKSFGVPKDFQKSVKLPDLKPSISIRSELKFSVDVIIPTFNRKDYLIQVLQDLKYQTLLPEKVIIVEQNPEIGAATELEEIQFDKWPFEIVHLFIQKTGACNARNLAIKKVTSNWVFFADDDIRLGAGILEEASKEIEKYNIFALNMKCIQPGEESVFNKVKQWGSFASGTSIVRSSFVKKASFLMMYEYGHGEDIDFGMQLRNSGCDIIYHPGIEIIHLKASSGGFRSRPALPWETEEFLPKPSPTIMAYGLQHYTEQQLKGYKTSLFLKFYNSQSIKNPVKYFNIMEKRWEKSLEWGTNLITNHQEETVI